MLQLEKDLLEIQLQVSKWKPVVRKIVNPLYGYVVCEQIISNNQSYLDTMYKPNTQTKLDIKFKLDNTEDNNICCSNDFGICVRDGKFAYMFGDTIELTDVDVADGISYTLQLSKNGLYIDEHKVVDEFDTDTPFVSTDNLLLCAGYDNGDVSVLNSKSIYYCKVYDVDNFEYTVMEDGEMIMSVLDQVNEVDDTFDGFGGTDQEIKDNLDEVMNRRGIKHYIPDLVRNYVGARTDEDLEENYIFGFYNYADKKFYDATEGEFSGKDSKDYIELEYIKNSSTSTYIDTLIKGTSNIKAEIKIDRLSSTTGSQFFGAWNNSCIMGEVHQNRWDFYIGGTNSSNYKSIGSINDYPTTIIITISNTNLNIKNTSGAQLYNTTYNIGNWNTNLNIHLFGRNTSSGNANSEGIFNIYYCKIWDSNVLVRDLISVKRKSDDVVCMYDLVSGQFYENAGTGTFIAGPEV